MLATARLNFSSISDVAGWVVKHLLQMPASTRDVSCASPHLFGRRLAEFGISMSSCRLPALVRQPTLCVAELLAEPLCCCLMVVCNLVEVLAKLDGVRRWQN